MNLPLSAKEKKDKKGDCMKYDLRCGVERLYEVWRL